MTTIRDAIISLLDEEIEIDSMEQLISLLQSNHRRGYNRAWVRGQVEDLEQTNDITVTRNGTGRGHGARIRKNRNSPGYPRRKS